MCFILIKYHVCYGLIIIILNTVSCHTQWWISKLFLFDFSQKTSISYYELLIIIILIKAVIGQFEFLCHIHRKLCINFRSGSQTLELSVTSKYMTVTFLEYLHLLLSSH